MPDKSLCFVVSRIGEEDSQDRIAADWFLEAIVLPVMETRSDFTVERADKLSHPGLIDAQVIQRLLTAKLVIADLTGLNPNVFYEIGIRHMAQEPIIHMHEAGERIPFDVSLYRSIAYSRARPKDINAAKEALSSAVEIALSDAYEVENPVTNARGRIKLQQDATPEARVLMDQMSSLERRLLSLETETMRQFSSAGLGINYAAPIPGTVVSPEAFREGDFVFHARNGRGVVSAIRGNRIAVKFDNGKRVMCLPETLTIMAH